MKAFLLIVILDLVPGCDRSAGLPGLAMPHRALEPGEQVWSKLRDPVVASQLIGGSGCCRTRRARTREGYPRPGVTANGEVCTRSAVQQPHRRGTVVAHCRSGLCSGLRWGSRMVGGRNSTRFPRMVMSHPVACTHRWWAGQSRTQLFTSVWPW